MTNSQPTMPDGIIFVLAYLLILSVGAFFGGSVILSTALPAAIEIGVGGEFAVLISGTMSLLLGGLFAWTAWKVTRLSAVGRIWAIILASLIALIGALGIPWILIEEFGDDDLYMPLVTCILLLVSSLAVIRYLTTDAVRHLFVAKPKRSGI